MLAAAKSFDTKENFIQIEDKNLQKLFLTLDEIIVSLIKKFIWSELVESIFQSEKY